MAELQATETKNIDESRALLALSSRWTELVLRRLSPHLLTKERLKILEIGSAQGRALIGLTKSGHACYGIEPYMPAIKVSNQLMREENTIIYSIHGKAEEIPFRSNLFDLVLAFSVMEHVERLELSLQEVYRVLKPGGLFWFSSASSMCPIQGEIKGFPFFGWYPDTLKKKIMSWSLDKHPELIGYTKHPALHWWTPLNARRRLIASGFIKVWDRWDLSLLSEFHGFRRYMIGLAKENIFLRLIGDMMSPGCSYAARKNLNK